MKKGIIAVLFVCLLMTLTGCKTATDTASPEKIIKSDTSSHAVQVQTQEPIAHEVRVRLGTEPESLNPLTADTEDAIELAMNSYVGLYQYKNGKIVPALATDYPNISKDGLVYTITLKSSLWSNGDSLGAVDFARTWNRGNAKIYGEKVATAYDAIAENQDGSLQVQVVDPNTLKITLKQKNDSFLMELASPQFLPLHESYLDEDAANGQMVSNGAYILTGWMKNQQLIYQKNMNYMQADNVSNIQLDYCIYPEDAEAYQAYCDGKLAVTDDIPSSDVTVLYQNGSLHTYDVNATECFFANPNADLYKNMSQDQAVAFRKAISRLIDREYLTGAVGQLDQKQAQSALSYTSFQKLNLLSLLYIKGDYAHTGMSCSEEAKNLLSGCGYRFIINSDTTYTPKVPIVITAITDSDTQNLEILKSIQNDVSMIGITLNIQVLSREDYNKRVESEQYDFAVGRLLPTQRLIEHHKKWMNRYQMIPLYDSVDGYLCNDNVTGITSNSFGAKDYTKLVVEK